MNTPISGERNQKQAHLVQSVEPFFRSFRIDLFPSSDGSDCFLEGSDSSARFSDNGLNLVIRQQG